MNLTEGEQKLKCVLVTKGRTVHEIESVISQTGLSKIAENRLEEAQLKFPRLSPNLEKHFIGKLQSRKISQIVKTFDVIQTVESKKQAKLINQVGRRTRVMIQINLEGSAHRGGCTLEEFYSLRAFIESLENIELIGVMGMASQNKKNARQQFANLKSYQGNLAECSMGMSSDYQIAIDEGSTMLRLGTLLFEQGLPEGLSVQ